MANLFEGRKNVYTPKNSLRKWAKAGIIGAGIAYAAFVGVGNEGYKRLENRRLYEGYSPRQIQIADSLGTLSSEKIGSERAFDTYKTNISSAFFSGAKFAMGEKSKEAWEGRQKNKKDLGTSKQAQRVLELFQRTENYFDNPNVSVADKAAFRNALIKNSEVAGVRSIIQGAFRNPAIFFKTKLGLMKTSEIGIKGKIASVIKGKRKSGMVLEAVEKSNFGRVQYRQAMDRRENLNQALIRAFPGSKFRLGRR
ncbi:hypothetical protein HY989_02660 [Candidatus Micrarchaeota archaeon]|nr:hypothetical protein [Candidatus Micrarchaeota archaeon]